MNAERKEDYERLLFEDNISAILIVLNVLNIKANSIIRKAILTQDSKDVDKAMKIYRIISATTILINFYFLIRNYGFYQDSKERENYDNTLEAIRLIASIFVFIGSVLLAYVTFEEDVPMGEVEVS